MTGVRHIILVGAARSGTKLVRDLVHEATGIGRVPYDISFVWRYGQQVPHDILDPEALTARQRAFIRGYVDRYAAGRPPVVIEKTVGNSLRVPYVHRVLPAATFVHLVRDGVDTIESTRRQWRATPDRRYLVAKARHFPIRMIPSYGLTFAKQQMRRMGDEQSHVSSWGVRYPGIDEDISTEDLLTVCARQWVWSVQRAEEAFRDLELPVVRVRYEDVVSAPVETLARILRDLELPVNEAALTRVAASVRADRAGSGRSALKREERALIDREVGPALLAAGYPLASEENRGVDNR